eukprot:62041-Alexandrium_andersonii.AAC.1
MAPVAQLATDLAQLHMFTVLWLGSAVVFYIIALIRWFTLARDAWARARAAWASLQRPLHAQLHEPNEDDYIMALLRCVMRA